MACFFIAANGPRALSYGVAASARDAVYEIKTFRRETPDLVYLRLFRSTEAARLFRDRFLHYGREERARLVERQNPLWADLTYDLFPDGVLELAFSGPSDPWDEEDDGGGSLARLERFPTDPVGVLVGHNAAPWPLEAEEHSMTVH